MQESIVWLCSEYCMISCRSSSICFLLLCLNANCAALFCWRRRSNAWPEGGFRSLRWGGIVGLGKSAIFGSLAYPSFVGFDLDIGPLSHSIEVSASISQARVMPSWFDWSRNCLV